jgi:hypothetical protein
MRTINCRNIRREIEEASTGDSLRWVVSKHLSNCPACETFAREQMKLREIVSSLGTVEAPGDFDFRLRARLAADKRSPRPFALANVSFGPFGLRSAAMAMVLILVAAGILFIALRTRSGHSVPRQVAGAVPNVNPASAIEGKVAVTVNTPGAVQQPDTAVPGAAEIDKSSAPLPAKRRGAGQSTVASYRENRPASRDLSSVGAVVLKDDQLAGNAFPIEASYQSLKVSIDDGRGSSRTISLPTVSFGSQRALSQGASPLMASARGDW